MKEDNGAAQGDYPRRAALINELCKLLKLASRPVRPDDPALFEHGGRLASTASGHMALDGEGNLQFERLLLDLVPHQHFEHLDDRELEKELTELVITYQRERGNRRQIASAFLDGLAREPMRRRVLFGVTDLSLPGTINIGMARVLPAGEIQPLGDRFAGTGLESCELYCEVIATGGTRRRLVDRAITRARLALSLLRVRLRQASRNIHEQQLLFDLHEVHAFEGSDGQWLPEWRRKPAPAPLGLTEYPPGWVDETEAEGAAIQAVGDQLGARIDTALEAMDMAARSITWRRRFPAFFSAVEALLVPEDCGSKAEVVTVRSIALELEYEDHFFPPSDTYLAYLLRGDLVHGTPVDVSWETERSRWADQIDAWARRMLSLYVRFSPDRHVRSAHGLVRAIDRSAGGNKARAWLTENGMGKIVEKYEVAVGYDPPSAGGGTPPVDLWVGIADSGNPDSAPRLDSESLSPEEKARSESPVAVAGRQIKGVAERLAALSCGTPHFPRTRAGRRSQFAAVRRAAPALRNPDYNRVYCACGSSPARLARRSRKASTSASSRSWINRKSATDRG
jgi:hypothetical protein